MPSKSLQLQVRITGEQKATLKQLARAAGQDVSTDVLARALPKPRVRFQQLIGALHSNAGRGYVLATLDDLLARLTNTQFAAALEPEPEGFDRLTPFLRNYVAAMLEQAAAEHRLVPPDWTRRVAPLNEPWFATPLRSLRLHLLRASPAAFRRRNLFVDADASRRV